MRIYIPGRAKGFQFCHPERSEDFNTLQQQINGVPRGENWRSPRMRIVHADEGRRLVHSDSPWLDSQTLVFRTQSLREFEPLLLSFGELLPVDCDESGLVFFNATRVLDALDEQASDVRRLPDDGGIFRVARYVLKPEVIVGIDAFRLSCLRASSTYVSERFVERFHATKLRGLDFHEVWSG